MNVGGSPRTGNGYGNGTPRKTNAVDLSSPLYQQCRADIEGRHPRLAREQFFSSIEAYMVICNVEDRALHLGGFNHMLNTPDDFEPPITLYFTYAAGNVKMQAVVADD